jgi:hypothetical protein
MAQDDKQLPSLIRQAGNFRVAYARWRAAGRPLRSPERVDELFTDVCTKCPSESFIPTGVDTGRCVECGCWLKRSTMFLNKLAWPTEACPNDHFSNEVEDPDNPGDQ